MKQEPPPRHGPGVPQCVCRLCGADAVFVFRKMLLGKHEASFFRCTRCESLQSGEPYWLAEAYSPEVDAIDTGAAQRVLHCFALSHIVMRMLGCRTALDFGGGSGLLCRLLRDIGHDAYWYDRYASPGYATGFAGSPDKSYDLVTAFEVVEHFPDPRTDFTQLFSGKPNALLLVTELYAGQDGDWTYIAPEEGQHIFFYSLKAMQLLAERFGYRLVRGHGFILFVRTPLTKIQQWVLEKLVRYRTVRWAKLFLLGRAARGAQADFDELTARVLDRAKTR